MPNYILPVLIVDRLKRIPIHMYMYTTNNKLVRDAHSSSVIMLTKHTRNKQVKEINIKSIFCFCRETDERRWWLYNFDCFFCFCCCLHYSFKLSSNLWTPNYSANFFFVADKIWMSLTCLNCVNRCDVINYFFLFWLIMCAFHTANVYQIFNIFLLPWFNYKE